jgi:serine/threonine protein kinase
MRGVFFTGIAFLSIFMSLVSVKGFGSVKTHVTRALKKKQYTHLGRYMRNKLGKKITLHELKRIARRTHSKKLLNAVRATQHFSWEKKNLHMKRSQFLQLAFFIETKVPRYVHKKQYHVRRKKSGLRNTIQVDRKTGRRFIQFDHKPWAFIGEGAKKKVLKALQYGKKHSRTVACAIQKRSMMNEKRMIKQLGGSPGIFHLRGFCKHKRAKRVITTIYSKRYRPGSLQDILERHEKLTFREKVKIARDILRGLATMHKKGIVHRDLAAKNFLVQLDKGRPGHRRVKAVVADLGRAVKAKKLKKNLVHATRRYTAPEGLYLKKMRNSKYYATDCYAIGSTIAWLVYGKEPSWIKRSYGKGSLHTMRRRNHRLVRKLNAATKHRRYRLIKKEKRHALTKREKCELIFLRMVSANPHKRGTVEKRYQEMNHLLKSM